MHPKAGALGRGKAYINSGFNIDALKSYDKLPITFSPYVQTALEHKLYNC